MKPLIALLTLAWLLLGSQLFFAQQTADTIFYNGKIVTMNNHEVNSNIGTIAQAIALREGKIVAVGSDVEIRRFGGPNTKSLDLKGRLVTPGFGVTHDHPPDWNLLNPTVVRKVVSDDMHIERFLNVPAKEVIEQFPRVLDEAVHKAKPGQWIRIALLYGKEYRWGSEILPILGRQINKEMLDLVAPNNPVMVRLGFVGMMLNKKGIEAAKKFYGDQWNKFLFSPLLDLPGMSAGSSEKAADCENAANMSFSCIRVTEESVEKKGICEVCYRQVEQDVLYEHEHAALEEIYRLGLSWTSAMGITLSGGSFYASGAARAYSALDRKGQLPIRIEWGWFWPYRNDFFQDPYFVETLVSREGMGSDFLWYGGMTPHMGMDCSTLPGTSPEVKKRERGCAFDDPFISRALYDYVKAGGRLMGDHQLGDKEIDTVLDIIEKASKDAGMSPQEIASKRHITEHMAMYPRPDQIPRFKKLGMMASGWDFFLWESRGLNIQRDYGERGANQVIPRRGLNDVGVMNSIEIDRPLSEYTNLSFFNVLYSGITRKDRDGKVTAPQQAVSREAMLKSATLWAANAVKKENVLGSLEPGKWADMVILDRDYLTIPVEDILKLHVLMTMVGGKMIHLAPSLGREWNLPPTGAQVELGGPAAQW